MNFFHLSSKYIKELFLCIVIIAAFVSVVQGFSNAIAYPLGSFDFQYDSAKYIAMGLDPYTESLHPTGMQEELGFDVYYGCLAANQFPSMLLMLIPFTFFSPVTAKYVFAFFNILCTAGFFILLRNWFCRRMTNYQFILLCCACLTSTPWRNNLGNGQHTIFSFFFFLFGLWLSDKKHPILSGISLSISFFKYTLTIPISIYYLYKKKYKEFAIAVFIHIVLTFAAASWLKKSVLEMIILPVKVSSTLSESGAFDLGSILCLGKASMPIAVILTFILAFYILSRNFYGTDFQIFSFLVMFSLIVIYHMQYDFFVLIVPLAIFGLQKWACPLGNIVRYCMWGIIAYPWYLSRILDRILPSGMEFTNIIYALYYYFVLILLMIAIRDNYRTQMP